MEKIYFEVPGMYLDFEPTHLEVSSGRDMASDFGIVHFAPNAKPDDTKTTANIWWSGNAKRKVESVLRLLDAAEKDRQ